MEKHHIVELRIGTCEDLIIETWWVSPLESGRTIDFAYSPSTIGVLTHHTKNDLRAMHFKACGLIDGKDILWDKCYTLPPSYFTETSVKLPAGFGF